MYHDLTRGSITRSLLLFALPMIAGDLLQQCYNIADTLIVGRVLGSGALAAVGSSYTLMTFLTSVFLGLSMGAGVLFSICRGKGDEARLRAAVLHAAGLILLCTLAVNLAVCAFLEPILTFLRVPDDIRGDMHAYLAIIFAGLLATSVYNFFACLLRALGNPAVPLAFLAVSAVLNIGLDLLFVLPLSMGIRGAALATVIAQYVSAFGVTAYIALRCREILPRRTELRFDAGVLRELANLSSLTCAQQSVMNFGILMVQGLVNSFGSATMAAFAAAVKIDSFAYLPVQDFGNAFSTFIAQNFGADDRERIRLGTRRAFSLCAVFSVAISVLVCLFASPLMRIFVTDSVVVAIGVRYLHIEAAFYIGIGFLFLLYGYYRAVKRPAMSVVLTVISLGTRVLLAYTFAPLIGRDAIWAAIPIGWVLADITGLAYMAYLSRKQNIL